MKEFRIILSLDDGYTKTWIDVWADDKEEARKKVMESLIFLEIKEKEVEG